MNAINWKKYYAKEPDYVDFSPDSENLEMHRCLAARSVFPRGGTSSILDVGCGDGFFCDWIKKNAKPDSVVGTDFAEKRLERARERYPDIEFVKAELPRLPFSDGQFDTVTCIEVLEHLADSDETLRELARVSGRYVVITVPNDETIREILCPHCLKAFPAGGHLHSFNEAKIADLSARAGLLIESLKSYSMTRENLRQALPAPVGYAAGIVLELLKKTKGTFLAARLTKRPRGD